jgi:hypothetical protein
MSVTKIRDCEQKCERGESSHNLKYDPRRAVLYKVTVDISAVSSYSPD